MRPQNRFSFFARPATASHWRFDARRLLKGRWFVLGRLQGTKDWQVAIRTGVNFTREPFAEVFGEVNQAGPKQRMPRSSRYRRLLQIDFVDESSKVSKKS